MLVQPKINLIGIMLMRIFLQANVMERNLRITTLTLCGKGSFSSAAKS